jgi:hypothetical protein
LLALLNPLAEVAIVLRLANGGSRGEQPGIAIQPSVAIAVISALLVSSHANPDGVSGLLAAEWQRQGLAIQHGIDQGRTAPTQP